MENTTDLAKFGNREKAMAADLLHAMVEHGLPDDFYDAGVTVMFNPNSGAVFLTNEEFETAMITDDGKLESFYLTPYAGHEGFYSDLIADLLDGHDAWHKEDMEYVQQLADNRGEESDSHKISAQCGCGTHNICRLCMDPLQDDRNEGYYDGSLCRDCEESLIANALPVAMVKELYFSVREVLDNLTDAGQDTDDTGNTLEDIKRAQDAADALQSLILKLQKAPAIE